MRSSDAALKRTMSATSTRMPAGFTASAFDAFLQSRDEPDWMMNLRRKAWGAYQERLDQPLNPEEFKRVDLRGLQPQKFGIQMDTAQPVALSTLLSDRASFGGVISHVNGACVSRRLEERLATKGVLFGSLPILLREHRTILEPYFMTRAVRPVVDRFSAWHAAFWTGGTVLYVPKNVTLDQPLYSLIGLSSPGAADLSHTLVILEEGASATFLEETSSADQTSAGLHVGAVELIVGRNAHLRYVQLQNWNQQTFHIAHQAGLVAADASLQWTVGGIGAKLAHIHQDVILEGRGAQGEVNGVTFATNRQLLSYYTQQTHKAENTRSDLLYKDVLRDQARVIWRGMIKVDPIAQKTDGYQRNDSLLLSPDARADAIPGLEIEADDVRCTHGATAGQVDAEQLFYLRSRGIDQHEAMHMIVEGFFHSVYDRIAPASASNRWNLDSDTDDDEAPRPISGSLAGLVAVRETLSHAMKQKLGIE